MTVHAAFEDFTLREIARADGAAFVRYLNDLSVAGWLARPPYPYTAADSAAFFDAGPNTWPERAAIDVNGELVGVVSVDPHLGYWLAPEHWGRGIVTRAARAILSAYFAATGAEEVSSGVFLGNEASLAVLRKLGFREVGQSTEFCRPLGQERVHIDLRLSRQDWEDRNGS